jgi:chemotaxis protein MotB
MTALSRKSHISQERWLVSYADFITLLFAFFVVLYSSSKADQKKQLLVSQAINAAFNSLGIFPDSARRKAGPTAPSGGTEQPLVAMNIVMGEDVLAPAKVKDDLDRVQRELEQMLSNQIAQHTVSIKMGRDGLVISLREAGFFGSGSAAPRPETLATLHQVADVLGKTPYELRIEGHTDNIPIHNAEFDSNWELSSARATRIARLFLSFDDIPASRLSAAGYAEFHPVSTNDTADGRAENRRVDLVVLPRAKIDLSEPTFTHQSGAWRKISEN